MIVTWKYEAREEFAFIYSQLRVIEQRVFAATMERVEKTLTEMPMDGGESRDWDGPGRLKRIWIVPPWRIEYLVSADGVKPFWEGRTCRK